jgi:hypothetical protein
MEMLVCCATLQRPTGRCYNVRCHKALGEFWKRWRNGVKENGNDILEEERKRK